MGLVQVRFFKAILCFNALSLCLSFGLSSFSSYKQYVIFPLKPS